MAIHETIFTFKLGDVSELSTSWFGDPTRKYMLLHVKMATRIYDSCGNSLIAVINLRLIMTIHGMVFTFKLGDVPQLSTSWFDSTTSKYLLLHVKTVIKFTTVAATSLVTL